MEDEALKLVEQIEKLAEKDISLIPVANELRRLYEYATRLPEDVEPPSYL